MARMIPPEILDDCSSTGEREVFYHLRNGVGTDDWIVLHSLGVAQHDRQVEGEIDFLIMIPKLGVLCLEVKGCTSLHRSEGLWYYGTSKKGDTRGPFRQAAEAMYSLRSRLLTEHKDLGDTVFWSAVVFPFIPFEKDSPEWHSWQVIDRPKWKARPFPELVIGVLKNAREHLSSCETSDWFDPTSESPSPKVCEIIAQSLRGDFEAKESPAAARRRRSAEVIRFTEEQYTALDAMKSNKRVVFEGPAGTGKTVLALEAVKRSIGVGQKTLFLCFNRNLGNELQSKCKPMGSKVVADTLHGIMVRLVGEHKVPEKPTQEFWHYELPELATLKAMELDEDEAYDALIIDESQDILRKEFVDFLDAVLKGGLRSGKWMMFGDFENQAIYGGNSLEETLDVLQIAVPVYTLGINCRNTPGIAAAASKIGRLSPDYTRILRPDNGPKTHPTYKLYGSRYPQADHLIETLNELWKQGFRGDDIVILSPCRTANSIVPSVDVSPWKERIKPLNGTGDGHIPCCTIHAFKGLEASAVIVTDIEKISSASDKALLYVAATRAQDRLILLVSENLIDDLHEAGCF